MYTKFFFLHGAKGDVLYFFGGPRICGMIFLCHSSQSSESPASLWVSLGSIADPSQVPRDSWRCLDVNMGWQAEGVNS